MKVPDDVVKIVNRPGRIGTLSTVDGDGRPNVAYFGSPRMTDPETLVMGLMGGRTLDNLERHPRAVFLSIAESPVNLQTPGWRLYVTVRELQREGPIVDGVRAEIAARVGEASVYVLPGVPHEMAAMFEQSVAPRLAAGGRSIVHREVHCFGRGESDIAAEIRNLRRRKSIHY